MTSLGDMIHKLQKSPDLQSEETSTVHDDWVAVKNSYSLASEVDKFYMDDSIEAPLFKAMKSSIQANRDDILGESPEL